MAWCLPGAELLTKPLMVSLLKLIYASLGLNALKDYTHNAIMDIHCSVMDLHNTIMDTIESCIYD